MSVSWETTPGLRRLCVCKVKWHMHVFVWLCSDTDLPDGPVASTDESQTLADEPMSPTGAGRPVCLYVRMSKVWAELVCVLLCLSYHFTRGDVVPHKRPRHQQTLGNKRSQISYKLKNRSKSNENFFLILCIKYLKL